MVDFLTNLFSNNANVRAAGAGGVPAGLNVDPNTGFIAPKARSSSFLQNLGVVLGALGQVRDNGIVGALGTAATGIGQNRALNAYNQYYTDEAIRQANLANQARLARKSVLQDQGFTGDQSNLSTEDYNAVKGTRSNQDFSDGVNRLIGQNFGTADQGQVGALAKLLLERQGAVNDTGATLNTLPQYAGPDTPIPPGPGGIVGGFNSPQGRVQFDPGTKTAQIGISASNNADSQPLGNPFAVGVPDVAQLLSGRKNEQDYAGTLKTLAETIRNNKADNANDRIKANAEAEKARKYQPGGRSSNPNADEAARQKIIQGQIEAIDGALAQRGYTDKNGVIVNNLNPERLPERNNLLNQRAALLQSLGLTGLPAAKNRPNAPITSFKQFIQGNK